MAYKKKSKAKLLAETRAKKLARDLGITFKENKEVEEKLQEILDGKKVKINMGKYDKLIAKNELNPDFINWLKENRNKEFIARKCKTNSIVSGTKYSLEGVEPWLFTIFDLDLIK